MSAIATWKRVLSVASVAILNRQRLGFSVKSLEKRTFKFFVTIPIMGEFTRLL
jgi:hypothetical protein